MNADWSRRLSAGYYAATGKKRAVRLPGDAAFSVEGDGEIAHLKLPASAVTGNMQSNASAFESWCLALHRWCGATVALSWVEPGEGRHPHYERFLYRVKRFDSLFGKNWFSYSDPTDAIGRSRALSAEGGLWLNVGGDKPKTQKPRDKDPQFWTEDQWECHLANSDVSHLERTFDLADGVKDQQFPVGLFSDSTPALGNAIFPGAKSAIDIIALKDTRLWIFELKKAGNVGFGALSELMFYTSVMRDASTGTFGFARPKAGSRSAVSPEMIRQVLQIDAVLLTPDLHPLIDDGILDLINDACGARWADQGPAIRYATATFDNTWAAEG
jgi:hypothetical protein